MVYELSKKRWGRLGICAARWPFWLYYVCNLNKRDYIAPVRHVFESRNVRSAPIIGADDRPLIRQAGLLWRTIYKTTVNTYRQRYTHWPYLHYEDPIRQIYASPHRGSAGRLEIESERIRDPDVPRQR